MWNLVASIALMACLVASIAILAVRSETIKELGNISDLIFLFCMDVFVVMGFILF